MVHFFQYLTGKNRRFYKTVICCVALRASSLNVFHYTPRSSVLARLASAPFLNSLPHPVVFQRPMNRARDRSTAVR